ncbi:hypothetical protein G5S34_04425 [Herbaspirillum frisingense]|uniref:AfaD family invasin n=1 Tax=Herbaspirillum frisingense TaxID=92645 RepID=UPI00160062F8|nr:AfaD family invasin [Herbaspirillum frisingense]QNB06092.1 hypothetical protein G5S34_04425 [Herbaspirillum frisingense]
MSRGIRRHLVLWACVLGCAVTQLAHGAQLNMVLHQQGIAKAGALHNGVRLGVLYLTYHGRHAGFKIWTDAPTLSLVDTNGQHPPIHVRLENDGWKSEPGSNYAVTTESTEDRVQLNVVTDGEQAVSAGSWKIDLQAAAF